MQCLSHDEFNRKYPKGAYLSRGTYGTVYVSGDNVIKKQSWDSVAFAKELCILSQFQHPNICPILDVTFSKDSSYIALPKGTPVLKAYLDGHISMQEIVTDIFSGMNYLNSNGIAHKDLKIDNCIYHEGRVKIIDLGLASFCDLYDTGYTFNDVAYTEPFRDPEYDEYKNNPITVELYSIATTIYYMLVNKYYAGLYRSYYISRREFEDLNVEPQIIDLLMLCQEPLKDRKSIEELILHPAIIKNRVVMASEELPLQRYSVLDIHKRASGSRNFSYCIKILFEWLYEASIKHGTEYYFLACDIIYRYLLNNTIDTSKLQLLGACALYIAYLLRGYPVYITDMVYLCARAYTKEDFMEMYCQMYSSLGGKFYNKTLWNTIEFSHEIYDFAVFMSKPDFESNLSYMIPNIQGEKINRYTYKMKKNSHVKFDRNVIIQILDREYEELPADDETSVNLNKIMRRLNTLAIRNVNHTQDQYYNDIISVTASNLDKLPLMTNKEAFDLYVRLLQNSISSGSDEMLRRTLKFRYSLSIQEIQDFRKQLRKVNIFTLTDEDINDIVNIPTLIPPPPAPILETEYFQNENDVITKLSELMNLTGFTGNKINYRVIDKTRNPQDKNYISSLTISSSNLTEAVIDMFNSLRNINPNIWIDQLDIINSFGDLLEWVNSCFNPQTLSDYYLVQI